MEKFDLSSCSKSALHHGNALRKTKTYPPDPNQTYSLAHTAQCKLHMAANAKDRDLRFVLGHAFTLDNVLLRIVEIENESARQVTRANEKVDDGKTGSLAGRRVSFSDNNARPSANTPPQQASAITNVNRESSPQPKARAKSPPPKQAKPVYDDDDDNKSTSSDDYDDPSSYFQEKPDDEEDFDDEDDGLGLTRFQSASAAPPRMVSPSSSSSDEEDDDEPGPPSPPTPTLPEDVDIKEVMAGEEDKELGEIYESLRDCPCHHGRSKGGAAIENKGVWEIKGKNEGQDGKRLMLIKC